MSVRELRKLPAAEQADAWREAIEAARDRKPKLAAVREIVARRLGAASIPNCDGRCLVNGQLVADPPDVAAMRAGGKLADGIVPEIVEPGRASDAGGPSASASQAPELTDEEWLDALPLSSALDGSQRETFRADALAFRRLQAARKAFARHAAEATRSLRRKGPYRWRVERFLKVSSPEKWIICPAPEDGGCGGSGQVPLIGRCNRCHGAGYWIK